MRITLAETSGKGFWKQINKIDREFSDGRALDGEWLDAGKEIEIEDGAFVVRRWTERRSTPIALYRVDSESTGDVYGRNVGLVQIGKTYDWDAQLLSFLDHVESSMGSVDPRAEAIAKIRELMSQHGITIEELSNA